MGDSKKEIDYMANKIVNGKYFDCKEKGPWRASVKTENLEILSVSQFTLYGRVHKGTKPDFHHAMPSKDSKVLYDQFLEKLKSEHDETKIFDGEFGADMKVSLVNDGPV
eukprot:CAMPEP_0168597108 /NCGR_PEP_ID=MMETSP0420-20121227/10440_1 /TAXON_ID=498008 /ORGANISM="Pessonella sp." /LENGTH=108 /DNA_ID=CAMNT_0008633841 /DNA_START=121 /DNA_END=443 /DNA_ORIENTATION=-